MRTTPEITAVPETARCDLLDRADVYLIFEREKD